MQAKARAIDFLVKAEEPVPVPRMIEELTWLIDAADELDTWESRRCSVQAHHLLAIFDEHVARDEWPYEGDPNDPAPLYGHWPAYTHEDVDGWWELDVVEGSVWFTFGSRDKLRERLFGPPPWPHSPGLPEPGSYAAMPQGEHDTPAFEDFEDD